MDTEYEERVRDQINQYLDEEIHGLPEIFHVWSHNFLAPGLKDVFNIDRIVDVYLSAAKEATADFGQHCEIISVGCGDGTVEIELAEEILALGNDNFKLTGLDISPVLIERFEAQVAAKNLGRWIAPLAQDLNQLENIGRANMVMANHSLHHMVDLEQLFEGIARSLAPGGIFATCDMIGRNGHMRWEEAETALQLMWPLLSEKQRYHHMLKRSDADRFVDHDCSGEGFEGIRAQDILALILQHFNPYRFFGYGGFIDVLVDRGYGPGFDRNDERDRNLIVAMAQINDMMLDAGMIKPTIMIAHFTVDDRGQHFYRDRTAAASVRDPDTPPRWVTHYR